MDADPAADAVLREYLHRLHAAAWALDPARRDELVDEVREHIDAALADEPSTTGQGHEVAARNVLERLGPPEDIVRAETEDGLAPPRVVDAAVPAANVVQSRPGVPSRSRPSRRWRSGACCCPFSAPWSASS